jgi:hypothetical protein
MHISIYATIHTSVHPARIADAMCPRTSKTGEKYVLSFAFSKTSNFCLESTLCFLQLTHQTREVGRFLTRIVAPILRFCACVAMKEREREGGGVRLLQFSRDLMIPPISDERC